MTIKSIRITTQNEKAIKSVLPTEDAEFHLLNSIRKYLLIHEEEFGRSHQVIDEETRLKEYYTIRGEGDWTIIGKRSSLDSVILGIYITRVHFEEILKEWNFADDQLRAMEGQYFVYNKTEKTYEVLNEDELWARYRKVEDLAKHWCALEEIIEDESNVVLERPTNIDWATDEYAIVVGRANFKRIRNLRNDPDEKLVPFLGYILVVDSGSPGRHYNYYLPTDFERLYDFEGTLSVKSGWKPVRKKVFAQVNITHPNEITEEQVEQWIEAETTESFRPIPQFPGYEVNREGIVRNVNNGRTLATYVVVWKNGKSYRMATELLAHSAFKTEDQ